LPTSTAILSKTYHGDLTPNLGIAYMINSKTVARASYSVTYNPPIAWGYGYTDAHELQSFVDLNRAQYLLAGYF
jgi:outer membrane receptor protein involved in Fe transport